MNTSFFTRKSFVKTVVSSTSMTALLLAVTITPLRADWPNANATKWVQYPDKTGYDVLAAQLAAGARPLIVADDFPCRKTGPISDIHLWTSWLGNTLDQNIPITLSIWSDVPAITNAAGVVTPSHPGSLQWSQIFAPGQYKIKVWQTADELFWNPDPWPAGQILGPDTMIWQYNFYPTNPFVQQGSFANPLVYWLSVTAGANTAMFGWKTATNHWNDDAVFGHLDANGIPMQDWQEIHDPLNPARSLDMAFAITTPTDVTNLPPPNTTNKWVQLPDVQNGLDVKATFQSIVADDFPCKAAGTITNIQVWASWQNNATPDPNTVFVVGIWNDQPSSTANLYSRPGTLLWTETFSPGNYSLATAGTGNEQFYDPDTGQMSPESVIWRYNFNPKNPFCQKGSTNAPIVYWLSVYAKTATPNLFGWKTSTNHWNDDAVYGHVNATGTALKDWKDLHDPRTPANNISLDLAFLINNGPPSADCDPNIKPKYVQSPDPSTNGMDVKATVTNILADDFPCRQPGRINGITVWGSWFGDKVDPNVTFQLGLWTDVPRKPGTTNFSHPGQLLCTQTFYPPTSAATSLLRYKASLAVPNVQERFYDPNLPGLPGLIGNDTQIWRYDFYPNLPCWRQDGGLPAQKVYWLSLVATTTDTTQFLFGWKTTTNHWNDDAVFGHVGTAGSLGDWKDLHDPRTSNSLDLSFALRSLAIVSVNKDLINTTPVPVDGIRIVVNGIREVTAHYDESAPTNWPNFQASYVGGNTVLQWNGKTVLPGALTHVGAEMAGNGGSSLNIVSMAWLLGPTVVGTPIQLNYRLLGNGTVLVLANDFVPANVMVAGGFIEYFADPTPLDLMKPNGNRNPIQTYALPVDQGNHLQPGGVMRIPLQQQIPPEARYAMLHVMLNNEQGSPATEDFLQLPLDMELQPFIHRAEIMGGILHVFFFPVSGRNYGAQESHTLFPDSFFDVFTELTGFDTEMNVMFPTTGPQSFFRIRLEPE